MGHYCRICGRNRANERFSGRGHKAHICKDCKRLPKAKRQAIEQKEEIFDFMMQSHISKKNIDRLNVLIASENPEIAELARVVLEVAKVKPYKKRRLKMLTKERSDLMKRMEEVGLIWANGDEEFTESDIEKDMEEMELNFEDWSHDENVFVDMKYPVDYNSDELPC